MKLEAKEDKIKPKGLWRANLKFSHLATENPPHSAALIKFQGAQGRETGTKWAGTTPPPFSLYPPPYVEPTRCEFQRKGKIQGLGRYTRESHHTHPSVTLLQASIQPTSALRTYLALNREDHFTPQEPPPLLLP